MTAEQPGPWWARWTWAAVAFIGGIGMAVAAALLWGRRPPAPDTRARPDTEAPKVKAADDALVARDTALTAAAAEPDRAERLSALGALVDERGKEPGR